MHIRILKYIHQLLNDVKFWMLIVDIQYKYLIFFVRSVVYLRDKIITACLCNRLGHVFMLLCIRYNHRCY